MLHSPAVADSTVAEAANRMANALQLDCMIGIATRCDHPHQNPESLANPRRALSVQLHSQTVSTLRYRTTRIGQLTGYHLRDVDTG